MQKTPKKKIKIKRIAFKLFFFLNAHFIYSKPK